jgi:DNA-binding XRE family transcriptional regulator
MPPLNLKKRQRIAELRAEGWTTDMIARAVDASIQSVRGYERRMDAPKLKRGAPACPKIAERNKAIYEARQQGYSLAKLAQTHKLTKEHVRIIILREAEKRQQRQVTLSAHA